MRKENRGANRRRAASGMYGGLLSLYWAPVCIVLWGVFGPWERKHGSVNNRWYNRVYTHIHTNIYTQNEFIFCACSIAWLLFFLFKWLEKKKISTARWWHMMNACLSKFINTRTHTPVILWPPIDICVYVCRKKWKSFSLNMCQFEWKWLQFCILNEIQWIVKVVFLNTS